MPFRIVVVVNKSKVGISLCQPKSRQRIWQRPQSIEQASRVARLASRRVASHISSAAKTKRRAIGCPSLNPTNTTPHRQPRPQLGPFWATVCSANLSFCQISVAVWVESGGGRQPVRSSSRGQRQDSTARRRSEWMWLTVQYARRAKLTNLRVNWITLEETSRVRVILNLTLFLLGSNV